MSKVVFGKFFKFDIDFHFFCLFWLDTLVNYVS